MLVIGGTYQDKLLSPAPVPDKDQIWSYDLESGMWQNVVIKNQGGENAVDDLVPWNLVYHSVFKIDSNNIGCLWFHTNTSESGSYNSMMTSVFNIKKCTWKNLKVASLNQNDSFIYRFGHEIYPVYDMECDRVSKILVLGGIDLMNPSGDKGKFPCTQIDFASEMPKELNTLDEKEKQDEKSSAPKVQKKFKEDE